MKIKHLARIVLLSVLFFIGSCNVVEDVIPPIPPVDGGSTPTQTLTGDEISERAIEAQGGREAISTIKTMKMLEVSHDHGKTLHYNTYISVPDKLVAEQPGYIVDKSILNGDKAIRISPYGTRDLTGAELILMQEEAMIVEELYHKTAGHTLKFVGEVTMNGETVYHVDVTLANGSKRSNYYSKEKAFLVAMKDEFGAMHHYLDYQETNGIKLPHHYMIVSNNDTISHNISTIEFNPEIDESIFNLDQE